MHTIISAWRMHCQDVIVSVKRYQRTKPKMTELNRYHIPICTDDEFHESRESRPFPRNDLKLTPCREGLVIFGTENSTLGNVGLEIREIFSLSVGREALKTSDGRATEPDSRL